MVFHRLYDGTPRLVRMCAIAESAFGGGFEYLAEIMANLLWLHVKGAEALDAWSVDEKRG